MSNQQWEMLQQSVNELVEVAKDKKSIAWFKVVDEYYSKDLDLLFN